MKNKKLFVSCEKYEDILHLNLIVSAFFES